MEDILVDWLAAFAKMAGIAAEGMASIIGVALVIMVFMVIVTSGKIFFWMLARFGHTFTPISPTNLSPQQRQFMMDDVYHPLGKKLD